MLINKNQKTSQIIHQKIMQILAKNEFFIILTSTFTIFHRMLLNRFVIKMNQQQQNLDIDVEGVNQSPRKLNWTKVLFDYHICLDAEAFQKWDGDLSMPSQQILEKDIPRTRCQDPLMKKQSFRQVLRRITTFYCKQNGVTYQQGLLQVVYPFALLRRKQFKTKKCYAYFNAFMRKHFPKVLVQRMVEGKKQLPHAILAITLTELLLKFHYPTISHCFKENEVPMSLIATQQLLTIFAKGLPIKFVYQIYDYFIQKNDPNYIFYMEVALIGLEQHALLQSASTGTIHKEVQSLKKLNSIAQIKKWFNLAQQIANKTPSSFALIANEFCFSNRNLLSTQDVQKMLKSQQLVAGEYLPINMEQICKNPNLYILLTFQQIKVNNSQPLTIRKINTLKAPLPQQFEQQKIYVLVAHQKNLKQEIQGLIKYSQNLPHCRFLMLREHLVEDKNSKCQIF